MKPPIHDAADEMDPTLGAMLSVAGAARHGCEAESSAKRLDEFAPRVSHQLPELSGWSRGATVRRGFSVVVAEFTTAAPVERDFIGGDHLKLHCRLDGVSLVSSGGGQAVSEAGRLSFLVQPPGSIKREVVNPDARNRLITLVCARDFAQGLFPRDTALPEALGDYLRGPVATFAFRDAPLPPAVRLVAEELLALGTDRLADLMLEAKSLELLFLCLRELSDAAGSDPIRPRTRAKVRMLCELLASEEGGGMGIAQLSRALAWNETQMMEGFRQVTGSTISAYRQRLRMDRALSELRGTDRSVSEIAYDAGYEHPSNFATAFKRTFGFSPRASRARFV